MPYDSVHASRTKVHPCIPKSQMLSNRPDFQ